MGYPCGMKRYLALPMGEASGIGPEIIIRALTSGKDNWYGPVIVVGDRALFRRTSLDLHLPLPFTSYVTDDEELGSEMVAGEDLIFYDIPCIDLESFSYASPSANTGRAVYETTVKAVSLIQNSYASALVTVPLDARALSAAGIETNRYESLVSRLVGSVRSMGMLDAGGVKIFSHSHYIPLRQALDLVTPEAILDTIIRVDSLTQEQQVFNLDKPLAIASVNPHYSDSLGWDREEREVLIPSVEKARSIGIDIVGPVSGDVLMHRAARGDYRAVIALFYDQAHIAAMSLDYDRTVTIDWGWPFLAVRVDRSARMEQAGRGVARAETLIQALSVARDYITKGVVS